MRLIDADELMKEFGRHDGTWWAEGKVEEAPTIDAIPVVRCKDCKHRGNLYFDNGELRGHCCDEEHGLCDEVKDNDYCSYGDRK